MSDPKLTPEYIIKSAETMLQDMRTNKNNPYTDIEVLVWERAIMLLRSQAEAGIVLTEFLRKYSLLVNKDMDTLTQEALETYKAKQNKQ